MTIVSRAMMSTAPVSAATVSTAPVPAPAAAAAAAAAPAPAPAPAPALADRWQHEVAKCAPDQPGEWRGEWEQCTVLATGQTAGHTLVTHCQAGPNSLVMDGHTLVVLAAAEPATYIPRLYTRGIYSVEASRLRL